MTRQLNDIISAAARRLEVELKGDATRIRTLGVELTAGLALCAGQEGFDEALRAARDVMSLALGIEAAVIGDLADAELRGIIYGFLAGAA